MTLWLFRPPILSGPPKLLSRSVVRMPLLGTYWPPLSLTAAGIKTPIQ